MWQQLNTLVERHTATVVAHVPEPDYPLNTELVAWRKTVCARLAKLAAQGETSFNLVFVTSVFCHSTPVPQMRCDGGLGADLECVPAPLRSWLRAHVTESGGIHYSAPDMSKIMVRHHMATLVQDYAKRLVAEWPECNVKVSYCREREAPKVCEGVARLVDHGLFFDWSENPTSKK